MVDKSRYSTDLKSLEMIMHLVKVILALWLDSLCIAFTDYEIVKGAIFEKALFEEVAKDFLRCTRRCQTGLPKETIPMPIPILCQTLCRITGSISSAFNEQT